VGSSVAFLSPTRQSSTAAARSACDADPSCTMFTTDGWIVGTTIYLTATDSGKISDLQDILDPKSSRRGKHVEMGWQKPYCGECNDAPGCCGSSKQGDPCCGTYVAAVTPTHGQLALQSGVTSAPPDFTAKTCAWDDKSCLVQATNAPCTGSKLEAAVVMDKCRSGHCRSSQRCTVPVLGAPLGASRYLAAEESAGQVVKLDQRCFTMSLDRVQRDHPKCCQLCWSSCCAAAAQHDKNWSSFNIRLWRGVRSRSRGAALDFPAIGTCSK
jgi:hypothetical protein